MAAAVKIQGHDWYKFSTAEIVPATSGRVPFVELRAHPTSRRACNAGAARGTHRGSMQDRPGGLDTVSACVGWLGKVLAFGVQRSAGSLRDRRAEVASGDARVGLRRGPQTAEHRR